MRDTIKELKEIEQEQLNLELFGEHENGVLKQEEQPRNELSRKSGSKRGLWLILTGVFLMALMAGRINPWPWVMVLVVARLYQKWHGLRQVYGPDGRPTRDAFTWLALSALLTVLLVAGIPNLWPLMLIGMGVIFLLNRR
jgi:hypothetical protein